MFRFGVGVFFFGFLRCGLLVGFLVLVVGVFVAGVWCAGLVLLILVARLAVGVVCPVDSALM
ncbi:hypothetical protein, partial [Pseudomonas syringae group genomosp. 7]|uniref:hypothetical protein n=1 Tax=Pseudomonas syringae group genomosp. 7 TaxID=251699 RepID=UPI00376F5FD6